MQPAFIYVLQGYVIKVLSSAYVKCKMGVEAKDKSECFWSV